MKLVKLDDDVWVNPEHVILVERCGTGTEVWVRGRVHRVELDVYEVLDRLDPKTEPYTPERIPDDAVVTMGKQWRYK